MKKTLKRSKDKMLFGVCGGIAEYFGWDSTLVRLGYFFLSVFSFVFPGILIYIVAAVVMPASE